MSSHRFLFVHGAWQGAWCFDLLKLELQRRAVLCEAIDLPALGDDQTPLAGATFEAGVERILGAVGRRQNVTLVGHSFGGFYITEAALRSSGRVRALVYLAAYIPRYGDTFADIAERMPVEPGFRACFRREEGDGALRIDAAAAVPLLYHDVAPGIAAAAAARLRPQPLEPYQSAIIGATDAEPRRVHRHAILAEDDRVFAYKNALDVAERAEVPVQTLPGGHCPFLARPKAVADLLLGVE